MMKSAEIRQQFLTFFEKKGHTIVPSAPIVVKNDPTLLFTNAGMNQFKEYFLGEKPAPFSRAADTQKCLRVSGKHNDLEEVGVDTYHHTMFEMLGNWSFGNGTNGAVPYFKEEAIAWSWELLTEVYTISKDDLYVTIFEGDEKEGLPRDEESYQFWKKWISEDRIILGNKKDNFWEMGDTGPCGPCTEIHVDCRTKEEKEKTPGKLLVNQDDPQVIEIWNNVFIQYNRKKDSSLELLPARHVDTGMGFERLVRVLQNKKSNYDTDVFSGTINEIEKISGKKYDAGDSKEAVAFRVVADHIRAVAFPIADGQLPSNTGAGYVIRRILRRAVRYYFSYLEIKEPLLYRLVPVIAAQFETIFPELNAQIDFVTRVIREEEHNFLKTLDTGLKRLEIIMNSGENIDGKTAFELYDTYGFPIDLTNLIASEKGLTVDHKGFEVEMEQQKNRSRAATLVNTDDWIVLEDEAQSEFVGYEHEAWKTHVIKYRKASQQGKTSYQIVLKQTPFYAESGGQIGDKGELNFDGEIVAVTNTKKENDLIVHFTSALPKNIHGEVLAKIEQADRKKIKAHHSATHLLHAALRKVLGTHVAQKGSLVTEHSLRFDFTHFAKVTQEELDEVAKIVNAKIRENVPVSVSVMNKEDAMKTGAMALFGEKYGDKVRVVTMDPAYSIELCGGTHVASTGDLGFFKITYETAVGAGIRRIEAVAGEAAEIVLNHEAQLLSAIRERFKNPKDLLKSVDHLFVENSEVKKQVEKLGEQQIAGQRDQLLQKVTSVNGKPFLGEIVEVSSADALKKLALLLKTSSPDAVILLLSDVGGKAAIAVGLPESAADENHWDATKIIKEKIAPLIKGGGGGNKYLATAGGQQVDHFAEAIELIKAML